jgi:DNA-binding MarR family transcriptional regulator
MHKASVQRRAPKTTAAETRPVRPERVDTDAPSALSLGVLSQVLGYHLAQATVTTGALFERHVGQPLKLRKVEYSLLMLLLANGPLSPKRVGRALALSPPNLTVLLDRMQERGLIRRERSLTDGRSQNIVLADAGQRVAKTGAALAATMEAELDECLTRAERLMLIELLRKVARQ